MPAEAPFPRGAGGTAPAKGKASSAAADANKSTGKSLGKRAAPEDAGDYLFGTRPVPKDKKSKTAIGGAKGEQVIRAARAAAEVGAGMVLEQKGRPNKLELVSFKKLTKGTLVLGVVMRVSQDDLIVALPSSLTGIVRRAEISDQLHNISEAPPAIKKGVKRYHDESPNGAPSLADYVKEGQVVSCAVKSLSSTGAAGGRRIELSLRASVINKGLTLDQLREGASVWGSISSVEDHGYVVGLGVEGVSAFLHRADVHPTGSTLIVGQPIDCAVKACKSAARAVFLTNEPTLVREATAGGGSKRGSSGGSSGLNLRGLKPGMLIEGLVEAQLQNGVLVSFLGYFSGGLDHNHMSGLTASGIGGWRAVCSIGAKIQARILMVDYAAKAIRLTQRPHLLALRAPQNIPAAGTAVPSATIIRIDPTLGMLLQLPPNADDGHHSSAGAYVHISRISDTRADHLERSFKIGQEVECRIVGSSLVEGWAAASLKASVIKAAVLTYSDVRPGQVLEGEILAVESFGMLINIGEGIRALCPNMHLSDVTLKRPKNRFKIGSKVTCRVLVAEAKERKLLVTLKKTMVKDTSLNIITSYEQATRGITATGFVTKVGVFGIVITFYNNVHGLVPAKVLAKQGVESITDAYSVGQVLKVIVMKAQPTATPPSLLLTLDVSGKLTESTVDNLIDSSNNNTAATSQTDTDIDESAETSAAAAAVESSDAAQHSCPVSVGDIVSGTVVSSKRQAHQQISGNDDTPVLHIQLDGVIGLLPVTHICDHAAYGPAIARTYTEGTVIDNILVLEITRHGIPILSLKPLLLAAVQHGIKGDAGSTLPSSHDVKSGTMTIGLGDVTAGVVSKVQDFGVFVKFMGGLTALCPRALVADQFVKDPTGMFRAGDSTRCAVQRVDTDTGRIVATFKRTVVPACSSALFLRTLLEEGVRAANAAADTTVSNGNETSDLQSAVTITNADRPLPDLIKYPIGCTRDATVIKASEYIAVLTGDNDGAAMIYTLPDTTDDTNAIAAVDVDVGDRVKVRVLSYDPSDRLLEVALDPDIVKGGRSKARKAAIAVPHAINVEVAATVLLAKSDALYAIVMLEAGELGILSIADYHCPLRTVADAIGSGQTLEVGARIKASIRGIMSSTGPYAGVTILSLLEEAQHKATRRMRKSVQQEGAESTAAIDTNAENRKKKQALKDSKARKPKAARDLGPVITRSELVVGAVVQAHVKKVEASVLELRINLETTAAATQSTVTDTGVTDAVSKRSAKRQRTNSTTSVESNDNNNSSKTRVTRSSNRKASMDSTVSSVDGDNMDVINDHDVKESNTVTCKQQRVKSYVHINDACTPSIMAGTDEAKAAIAKYINDKDADATDTLPPWHPFAKLNKGDEVQAKIISITDTPNTLIIHYTIDPNRIAASASSIDASKSSKKSSKSKKSKASATATNDNNVNIESSSLSWHDESKLPQQGSVYRGIITEMLLNTSAIGCWVSLSSPVSMDNDTLHSDDNTVKGFVSLIEMSDDPTVLMNPTASYYIGMSVMIGVMHVNKDRHSLDLTFRLDRTSTTDDADTSINRISSSQYGIHGIHYNVGDVIVGKVNMKRNSIMAPSIMIDLQGHHTGRVCVTEINDIDEWTDTTAKSLQHGAIVRCIVLEAEGSRIDLSCRKSRIIAAESLSSSANNTNNTASIQEIVADDMTPAVNTVARGFVCGISKAGCFVRLSRKVTARVLLKDLSDNFVSSPEHEFPLGRLVAGRILTQESDKSKSSLTMSLRPSAVVSDGSYMSYNTIQKGAHVKGTVKTVSDYGVFIQLDNSEVRGMCHKSEAADHKVEDLTKAYSEGDYVKAIVLKVDSEKRRVSLGLKPSYFIDAESSDDSDDSDSDDSDNEQTQQHRSLVSQPSIKSSVKSASGIVNTNKDSDSDIDDSDDEQAQDGDANDSDSDSNSDDDNSNDVFNATAAIKANSSSLNSTNLAFNFDDFNVGTASHNNDIDSDSSVSDDENSNEDSDNDDNTSSKRSKHASRKRAAERRKEEEKLRAQELAMLDDNQTPETAADFEKLLVATPNSSYLWLKYMAFQLSLADIDAARAVAERALKRILFRQEDERLNVWVGLMNLELKYGSREELNNVFERACSAAHPKRIHLRLAEAYERAGELSDAEAVLSRAASRFKTSKKVWMAYQRIRLLRGDDAGARDLLRRSLQSLSRHKHVAVTSRFAQEEFALGSRDRGRAIFEGLLASYPKRLDLWNVFIDREVKANEISAARSLFERLITLDLSPRRMKGVFKKFLSFEATHGDAKRADAVKDKARAYVQSLA